jgi:hypothetical protein
LLPAAEAEEMAARTTFFLADTAGRYEYGLPGWEPFRAAVGDTPAARRVFADLLKTPDNRALLAATSQPAPALGRAILGRREQLRPMLSRPIASADVGGVTADVAVLILAESLVSEKDAPLDGLPIHYARFFYQKIGQEAVAGTGPTGPVFRKLALRWLDTQDGFDGAVYRADMAAGLDLPSENKARYAARVLSTRRPQPRDAARYLTVVAAFDGREELPIVTRFLSDERVIDRGSAVQVRDVAMVASLQLTGQNPYDYGMSTRDGRPSRFDPTGYLFQNDAERTAVSKRDTALKKWREWDAEPKKQPSPDGQRNPF